MKAPVIPDTLAICRTCRDALAMAGKQECCDCLLETRFAAWAIADGALLNRGVPIDFSDAQQAARLPSGWGAAQMPQFRQEVDAPPKQPRREQWRLPASAEAQAFARRVTVRISLLLLGVFVAGLLFGRFG